MDQELKNIIKAFAEAMKEHGFTIEAAFAEKEDGWTFDLTVKSFKQD